MGFFSLPSLPPLPLSTAPSSFHLFLQLLSIGADARSHRITVLGRKPLSHLITDGVVNNGDDAQEIPRSSAIYRRRDISRIADTDDR